MIVPRWTWAALDGIPSALNGAGVACTTGACPSASGAPGGGAPSEGNVARSNGAAPGAWIIVRAVSMLWVGARASTSPEPSLAGDVLELGGSVRRRTSVLKTSLKRVARPGTARSEVAPDLSGGVESDAAGAAAVGASGALALGRLESFRFLPVLRPGPEDRRAA